MRATWFLWRLWSSIRHCYLYSSYLSWWKNWCLFGRLEISSSAPKETLYSTFETIGSCSSCPTVSQLTTLNWTDSMTALCWIKNQKVWKQNVQHRVEEIWELTTRDSGMCIMVYVKMVNFSKLFKPWFGMDLFLLTLILCMLCSFNTLFKG